MCVCVCVCASNASNAHGLTSTPDTRACALDACMRACMHACRSAAHHMHARMRTLPTAPLPSGFLAAFSAAAVCSAAARASAAAFSAAAFSASAFSAAAFSASAFSAAAFSAAALSAAAASAAALSAAAFSAAAFSSAALAASAAAASAEAVLASAAAAAGSSWAASGAPSSAVSSAGAAASACCGASAPGQIGGAGALARRRGEHGRACTARAPKRGSRRLAHGARAGADAPQQARLPSSCSSSAFCCSRTRAPAVRQPPMLKLTQIQIPRSRQRLRANDSGHARARPRAGVQRCDSRRARRPPCTRCRACVATRVWQRRAPRIAGSAALQCSWRAGAARGRRLALAHASPDRRGRRRARRSPPAAPRRLLPPTSPLLSPFSQGRGTGAAVSFNYGFVVQSYNWQALQLAPDYAPR